jgi:hypothetical protein
MPHIHQFNEEKDQNMSEIQSKSIWYNKILIQKSIWLYLGQFLSVFDDPGIEFTALYVGTWYNIRFYDKTGPNRFKPVFCGFMIIFKNERMLTGLQKTSP